MCPIRKRPPNFWKNAYREDLIARLTVCIALFNNSGGRLSGNHRSVQYCFVSPIKTKPLAFSGKRHRSGTILIARLLFYCR